MKWATKSDYVACRASIKPAINSWFMHAHLRESRFNSDCQRLILYDQAQLYRGTGQQHGNPEQSQYSQVQKYLHTYCHSSVIHHPRSSDQSHLAPITHTHRQYLGKSFTQNLREVYAQSLVSLRYQAVRVCLFFRDPRPLLSVSTTLFA